MPEMLPPTTRRDSITGLVLGVVLALALLKFGNPVVLKFSDATLPLAAVGSHESPSTLPELLFFAWPSAWAWACVAAACLAALPCWSWRTFAPRWALWLPLIWLSWQFIAAIDTISPALTRTTLAHFVGSTACYYLGLFSLSRVRHLATFFLPLLGGFLVVIGVGVYQHFVGLEETRRFFYELPNWREFPSSFLDKLSSNRIYSTLFYPNAFAGVILLLLPFILAGVWRFTARWQRSARLVLVAVIASASLACLYWSGSKAGWLILLAVGSLGFFHLPLGRRARTIGLVALLGIGLTGFIARYSGYFQRGATSAFARADYWSAALQVCRQNPGTGSGPGTFMIKYQAVKHPKAEMARLAHNDYLQQASDSGVPGFLAYTGWIWISLWSLYRERPVRTSLFWGSVWLGILGFAIQSLVEFGLYIPALAWTQFLFLGWMQARPWRRSD